ncbi:hypothetical protein EGW08_000212 [Elysia chlorotica]|uniref:Uncharacterized protein n=1 Tax=Elysia chlorotica TaxID=188477 RepID=A0A3S1BYI2_ELYCH|nr:hypothetical protein EGW08_000212 [Elysia chlorotica]
MRSPEVKTLQHRSCEERLEEATVAMDISIDRPCMMHLHCVDQQAQCGVWSVECTSDFLGLYHVAPSVGAAGGEHFIAGSVCQVLSYRAFSPTSPPVTSCYPLGGGGTPSGRCDRQNWEQRAGGERRGAAGHPGQARGVKPSHAKLRRARAKTGRPAGYIDLRLRIFLENSERAWLAPIKDYDSASPDYRHLNGLVLCFSYDKELMNVASSSPKIFPR